MHGLQYFSPNHNSVHLVNTGGIPFETPQNFLGAQVVDGRKQRQLSGTDPGTCEATVVTVVYLGTIGTIA